jgi:hypothetical protein
MMLLPLILNNGGLCGCEHDAARGTPLPGQIVTPGIAPEAGIVMATAAAVEERSYENACDGAQAYFDDLHEATTAFAEHDPGPSWSENLTFFLEYFRASNPPPILEEWTDANITFWAALSDYDAESTDLLYEHLDAIHAAEEELEDACEDYEFTEDFWG